jgi:hypothetical protein
MNLVAMRKIFSHLQLISLKAAEQTIDERGFWGLGEMRDLPNLQSFTLTAEQKYQIQIVSSSKNLLLYGDEDEDAEPYYGTDWTVVCSMHGTLRDLFLSYGLEPQFEFVIEHDEHKCFVVHDKNKLKIHDAHHDLISSNKLTDTQIDDLHDKFEKLILILFMRG